MEAVFRAAAKIRPGADIKATGWSTHSNGEDQECSPDLAFPPEHVSVICKPDSKAWRSHLLGAVPREPQHNSRRKAEKKGKQVFILTWVRDAERSHLSLQRSMGFKKTSVPEGLWWSR
ncbi:hypothetical protein chiPu_0007494 [Chiloscyllium punctatum]|uniref:Uncharacterized protein n=1 Tax=Chiloscyllium punctatum TaxID=137246 RepID=A0A401SF68_CHIPU|nr:hypothetical protein [Chiloscyllium punctatum]